MSKMYTTLSKHLDKGEERVSFYFSDDSGSAAFWMTVSQAKLLVAAMSAMTDSQPSVSERAGVSLNFMPDEREE